MRNGVPHFFRDKVDYDANCNEDQLTGSSVNFLHSHENINDKSTACINVE